jgi:hypothetical protein
VQVPQVPDVHVPVDVLQVTVLVCVPVLQLPQAWVVVGFVDSEQVCTLHVPHVQEEEHVCVPVLLQVCVSPDLHTPPPVQVPQVPDVQVPFEVLQVTVLVCVPVLQLPQAWLVAGFVAVSQLITLHVPHAQEDEQVCVPVLLQVCVAPAAHTPPPVQVPHALDVQVPFEVLQVTVLVCVPVLQLPQAWLATGLVALSQLITLQVPHVQEDEQVCVPVLLQACVAPTAQMPCPLQVPQLPVVQPPVFVLHVTVLV